MKGLRLINPELFQRSQYKDFSVSTWEEYMKIALHKAKEGFNRDEVPVGALIIDNKGKILESAYNLSITFNDPTAHAEVVVIRNTANRIGNYRLNEFVLITTLEPCIMCIGAMVQARINGLVFGTTDPKSGAVVSRLDVYKDLHWLNHKFWVIYGVLEKECAKILSDFFKAKR